MATNLDVSQQAVARTVLFTGPEVGVGRGVSTVTSVVAETPPTPNTLATA